MENEIKRLQRVWGGYASINKSASKELSDFPYSSLLLPRKNDLILDVGCGQGINMAMFSQLCGHVFGVDISPEMLKYASKYGHVLLCDFRNIPFQKETFDYIFSNVAICYVPDWPIAILEMARLLKPGGICIISTANTYSFISPLRNILYSVGLYNFGKTFHASINLLRKIGEESGLSAIKTVVHLIETSPDMKIRSIIYAVLVGMDNIINRIFSWWGGDAVVMFTKQKG